MKKTIITLSVLFIGFVTFAQDASKKENQFFEEGNSYWTADATFGVIAGWDAEQDVLKMGDEVNVGVTLGVARTFESNLFTAASVSFSVAESTGLWDNPLDYLAINLEGGYKFKTSGNFVPFIALGASYINAPNTIANSKSSIAINPSAGVNLWFSKSNWGATTKFGYRVASNEFMGNHRYLTIGVIRKF